ncbi:hypothetical protein BU197_14575 [Streptomyces sp. CBMA291]|nr:hypothetical protein [Streptomyces sp. CBMA291]MBD0715274.1 hypothetical protein [Streptomyces sp. CBMA370]MBD0717884.1 hypothetical protein [Streptomyces sp. CBMA370]
MLPDFVVEHARCELGTEHGDAAHGRYMWDTAKGTPSAVWFRWTDTSHWFEALPECETHTPAEACLLFARHPAAHSWEATRPRREARAGDPAGPVSAHR